MGLSTKILLALSVVTNNFKVSSNYVEYELDVNNGNKVCSVNFPHRDLEVQANSSVTIKYSLDEDTVLKKDFICIFFVKAPDHFGLFSVIQKMSFRRDPRTKNCSDYVQIRHARRSAVEKWLNMNLDSKTDSWGAPKICGDVQKLQEPISDASPTSPDIAPHADLNHEGWTQVKVHISKKKLKLKEKIEFEIVFTAFKPCDNGTGGYETCGHGTCILSSYFHDNIVNCPYSTCVDEKCVKYENADDSEGIVSTKVALTAVSSIFLSFFLFLGCIMMCRYAEMFCWGGSFNHDRGTELSQVEPTAPPITPSPDKDLPPSYETLFPERETPKDV